MIKLGLLFCVSVLFVCGKPSDTWSSEKKNQFSISSYNREIYCNTVEEIFTPSNEDEVRVIIQRAILEEKKVRVIGTRHTVNAQICTDGFAISTENLNHIFEIEEDEVDGHERVVVEPGVLLGDLDEWLHQRGKAIGYGHVGFREVSVGGVIATGAHGASVDHFASISALVESLTLIDSFGNKNEFNIHNTRDNPDLMRALRTHLGVFGVVTQVKLRIVPQFNLHMKSEFGSDEGLFQADGLLNELRSCHYGELLWFPHSKKIHKLCGIESEADAEEGADNYFLSPAASGASIRFYQSLLNFGAKHRRFNQYIEDLRYWSYKMIPSFRKQRGDGRMISTHEVIGPSHRMTSSRLLPNAIGFPQSNWEIGIPIVHVQEVLQLVRTQFEMNRMAASTMGVLLRFIPADHSLLLAHNAAQGAFKNGEPVALFEFIIYRPDGLSDAKLESYWRPFNELVRVLITQYSGRPHWGKNQEWMFSLTRENLNYGLNWDRFVELMHEQDPRGMFSNSFIKNVFGEPSSGR